MLQRGLSRLEPEPGGRKLDKMRELDQVCVSGLVEDIAFVGANERSHFILAQTHPIYGISRSVWVLLLYTPESLFCRCRCKSRILGGKCNLMEDM